MHESLAAGIALTMVAGLMSGTCILPLKFVRAWKFENVWLVFSVVSLIVIPWALAQELVSNLFGAYASLSLRQFPRIMARWPAERTDSTIVLTNSV